MESCLFGEECVGHSKRERQCLGQVGSLCFILKMSNGGIINPQLVVVGIKKDFVLSKSNLNRCIADKNFNVCNIIL